MSTSIVLADEQIVRHGLRGILEQRTDLEVVGEAPDGEKAVEVVSEQRPLLALLEIALPGRSGADVIRQIGERSPGTRCIVLSTLQTGRRVREAFAAGAQAYVVKTAATSELFEAIDSVLSGRVYLSPEIARHAIQEVARGAASGDPLDSLSPRELQVMELVCKGQSTRRVAESLGVSEKTAASHRHALMKKLGIRKVPDLVRFAVREGVIEP